MFHFFAGGPDQSGINIGAGLPGIRVSAISGLQCWLPYPTMLEPWWNWANFSQFWWKQLRRGVQVTLPTRSSKWNKGSNVSRHCSLALQLGVQLGKTHGAKVAKTLHAVDVILAILTQHRHVKFRPLLAQTCSERNSEGFTDALRRIISLE